MHFQKKKLFKKKLYFCVLISFEIKAYACRSGLATETDGVSYTFLSFGYKIDIAAYIVKSRV